MKKQNYTVSTSGKCNWCGEMDFLKPIKVSPKRSKMACTMCYNFFTSNKPEVPQDLLVKCRGNLELFYGRCVFEDKFRT